MALATRLKKSLNGGKSSSKRKNDKFGSRGNGSYRKHGEREDMKSLFSEKKFDRRGRDSDNRTFGRRPLDRNIRDFSRDDPEASMRNLRETRGMRGNERRPLFTEKKIGRNGRDSEDRTFGRRPIDRNRRGLSRDDPEASMRNPRETREMRGNERRPLSTEKKFGGNGRNSDDRIFGRRPINRNRRDFSRDGTDEETKSTSRPHEKRGGRHGERIPLRSEVIDQLKARGRNVGRNRRDVNVGDSEARTSNTTAREMRGDVRSKRDFGRCGKIDDKKEETDECVDSVEASSAKLRLKWKKMDKKQKVVNDRDQSKGEVLEKRTKNEDEDEQIAEEKSVRHQKRVLDKSGKKLRVGKISSDDGSAEKSAPVKKKKRVIKLDPYDISNKRLDDSAPIDDKNEEKDSDISKNAQFRAIQPSPSILSFVEDNLLGRRRLNELKDAGYNVNLSAPLDNIPFSTSTERERIEDNVFKNKLEFFAAAKISSSFPPPLIPEIAFAGRSNVGKSSLLNALTRQWGVVRTSDKPGLTQTINFFSLAPKLCLVDLPGYGFAYAKEEVKDAWEELVKEYVSTRVDLLRVCLLIDTKWGMKPRDHELIDLMERSKTPYHIVLTKTDLVFPIDVARRAMQIQENLKKNKSIINPVAMVSSKSGAGVRNLRSVLAKITRFVKP